MTWVRIDDAFTQHPKVLAAGPLAIAMQVAGLCYCNRNLTNGFIPWAVARTLVTWEFLEPPDDDGERRICEVGVTSGMAGETVNADYVIRLMLQTGMWVEVPGGYTIHDYTDYQPSREQVEAEHQTKVAAGQAGGRAAARARATTPSTAPAVAKSKPVPVPEPVPLIASTATATAQAREPANTFALFEQLTGHPIPGPILAQELEEAERDHTADCIAYAFREAAANEACTWSYCKAILAGHAAGQCGAAARKRPQRRDAKDRRRAAAAGARGAVPAAGPDLDAIKRYAAGEG